MGHVFEYVSHIEATIELQRNNVVPLKLAICSRQPVLDRISPYISHTHTHTHTHTYLHTYIHT